MPVYEQRYKSYTGEPRRRFRWLIVADQELRVLQSSRLFLGLVLFSMILVLARLAQILCVDVILQDPNHPLTPLLQQADFLKIDGEMFFEFIRLQVPITLIIMLFAGSGMICNDVQNRLVEVYFAKPLKWWDYLLGKLTALVVAGLIPTALPSIMLTGLHAALRPEVQHVRDAALWCAQCVGYSLVITISSAIFLLTVSSLSGNQRYSAIAAFMVPTVNSGIGGILARLLRDPDYLLISSFVSLDRFGHGIFLVENRMFSTHWAWGAAYTLIPVGLMLLVFIWRCRKMEYAR